MSLATSMIACAVLLVKILHVDGIPSLAMHRRLNMDGVPSADGHRKAETYMTSGGGSLENWNQVGDYDDDKPRGSGSGSTGVEFEAFSYDDAEYTYRTTHSGVQPYGPSEWHHGFPDCGLSSQSPINLALYDERREECDGILRFHPASCNSSDLDFTTDNSWFKVYLDQCEELSRLEFQGLEYELEQLHIHSVSEHTFGSSHHDAELHLVHLSMDEEYLVVSILMDADEYGGDDVISKLWGVLTAGMSSATDAGVSFTVNMYDILPSNPSFAHYSGSLTTPPCTEGVTWIVMSEPIRIGVLELDEYRNFAAELRDTKVSEHGHTNRPTQPLNGRVVRYCS